MNGKWTNLIGQSLDDLVSSGRADLVVGNLAWGEGPAQLPDETWIFSDIPNDTEYTWRFGEEPRSRRPANFVNGHFATSDGRLLSCEHGTRSVVENDQEGRRRQLVSRYGGFRLNSPNDIVEANDGSIWFTDPTYGIISNIEGYVSMPEQSRNRVYRLERHGKLTAQVEHLVQPNGLCFSPNGAKLYVADSGAERGPALGFDPAGPRVVWQFDIFNGRVAGSGFIFATVNEGVPDGLRCDREGNVWAATAAGLECFSSNGIRLGCFATPEVASNMCASWNGRTMLLTLATSAWLIRI